ncbi:MAG: 6-pyruvoyl tetrahydropterin synthase [Pseudomonadales bacterium]|nr:6-carboxytetrahydropterin synthase [Gammaproteobacteria bacterium]NNL57652.1 6-pyruvoyl tetrahydropterin synthase [Pseudomonadales bacterium]
MPHRLTTIEISKEDLKFSAAHFTIFSATERERLHGHNFRVRASVVAPVDDNGMCFNYQEIKSRLRTLCQSLDEYLLLPGESPYLQLSEQDNYYHASFNGEDMRFRKSDTRLLEIRNTTVEEFSNYILQQLVHSDNFFQANDVHSVTIAVSSGDGQWGASHWQRP